MNEWLYARLRKAKKMLEAYQYDKEYYIRNNRVESTYYNDLKSDYRKLENQIINEIKSFNKCKTEVYYDEKIKISDIHYLSNNGDQMGKVFIYNGEIYRGIYKNSMDDFNRMWGKGIYHILWKHNIIPQLSFTPYFTDEFPIVIKTEKVDIEKSSCWSYAMIRDACVLISILKNILHTVDCTLIDGHLNNITYNNGKPLFVDIGSIVPYRRTAAQEELVFAGIYKLLFRYIGNCMLSRMFIHDNDNINLFIYPRRYDLLTREYRFCLNVFKRYHLFHGNFLSRRITHKIFDYYDVDPEDIIALFPVKNNCYHCDDIDDRIIEFIGENIKGRSLTDVGGASDVIFKCIKNDYTPNAIKFLDYDENRLDQLYFKINNNRLGLKVSIRLYNYIYAQGNSELNDNTSDAVIVVNPIKKCPSFNGINQESVLNAIYRITREQALILCDYDEFENEFKWKMFEERLDCLFDYKKLCGKEKVLFKAIKRSL